MTAKVIYLGDLRCSSEHLQSNTLITTDAPTDNFGKGEAFSPTDLCATSLAQCALTTIAILGKNKIQIENSYAEVTKIMTNNPRKISEIQCKFFMKGNFSQTQKTFIEDTAHQCPVAQSLHPDIIQKFDFIYID